MNTGLVCYEGCKPNGVERKAACIYYDDQGQEVFRIWNVIFKNDLDTLYLPHPLLSWEQQQSKLFLYRLKVEGPMAWWHVSAKVYDSMRRQHHKMFDNPNKYLIKI